VYDAATNEGLANAGFLGCEKREPHQLSPANSFGYFLAERYDPLLTEGRPPILRKIPSQSKFVDCAEIYPTFHHAARQEQLVVLADGILPPSRGEARRLQTFSQDPPHQQ